MSDHADVIREQLRHLGPFRGGAGEAALDRLVAERDEWRLKWHEESGRAAQADSDRDEAEAERDSVILAQSAINAQAERAKARITELEAALRKIELWPYDVNADAHIDLRQVKEAARAALANEAECSAPGNCPQAGCPLCDPQGVLGGEDAS